MKKKKPLIVALGNNNKYQPLLQGKPQTKGMKAGRMFLLPGQACGEHSTNSNEELLVFLAGKGEVVIGENNLFQVDVGKICYIPPETIHNVRNTEDEPLVYVYCVTPINV